MGDCNDTHTAVTKHTKTSSTTSAPPVTTPQLRATAGRSALTEVPPTRTDSHRGRSRPVYDAGARHHTLQEAMLPASTSGTTQRSTWRKREALAPLPTPPDLSAFAAQAEPDTPKSAQEKLDNLFGRRNHQDKLGTITHQQRVGQQGSKTRNRLQLYDTLALGGSTPGENLDATLMRLVYGLSFSLWNEYGERQLADERWCNAFAAAAANTARTAAERQHHAAARRATVCVVGLGSAVTALGAAKAGAHVVWLERVARFGDVARSLASRNGLDARMEMVRVKQWADYVPEGASSGDGDSDKDDARFDAVLTEEASDDLLGDGLLRIARHAHTHLLRPGGLFVPCRARVYGALASLRVEDICGFDLSAFNAFRSNECA